MPNAKYKFIYLDQNIYGFLSSLDTPQKREYFSKIVTFANIIHAGNQIKFVYNLTTILETSQIKGKYRDIFVKRHLNCIKSITQGNYLIRTDKNYTLFKGRNPFILMNRWEQQKKELVKYAQALLNTDLTKEETLFFKELIKQQGDYTKAIVTALQQNTNFLTKQTRLYAKQLNNLTTQEALQFLEKETKKNTQFSSFDEFLKAYGAKDVNSQNMAKNLILEYAGYQALPLSKLLNKLSSPLNDSSIFSYVTDVIDIFVSDDKRLVKKLRDFCGQNYLLLNLDEFISYIEQINIKIAETTTLKYLDLYNQYIKPTIPL